MSAPPLVPPGPSRRRAGGMLLAYGIAGLLLMGGLFAATLAAGVMGRDGFERLDATIDQVVDVLTTTEAALDQGETTLTGVGVTLGETAGTIADAAALAAILGDAAITLADQAATFGLLGQNPLAGLEQPLRDAGASLDGLEGRLEAVAAALGANAADVTDLGVRLGDVADSLGASRDRLAAVDTGLGGAAMVALGVVLAIIAWLAVPAVAAIWVGRRWRAENPRD